MDCTLCARLHSWPLGFQLSLWESRWLGLNVSNMDLCVLSCVWLFTAPWTVAYQVPLSMEFYEQAYWSGLPSPTPGDLPDSEIEPTSLASPSLAGGFFTTYTGWSVISLCVCVCVCVCMLSYMWAGFGEKCTQYIKTSKWFSLINKNISSKIRWSAKNKRENKNINLIRTCFSFSSENIAVRFGKNWLTL